MWKLGDLSKDLTFLSLSAFICKIGMKCPTGFVLEVKLEHVYGI